MFFACLVLRVGLQVVAFLLQHPHGLIVGSLSAKKWVKCYFPDKSTKLAGMVVDLPSLSYIVFFDPNKHDVNKKKIRETVILV